MMERRKTIILSSRQNYVWSSMQEIIPHLERSWIQVKDYGQDIEIINVDAVKSPTLIKVALQAKHIVITCFNLKICNTLRFLKEDLSLDAKILFHIHNQSTIGLWPLEYFKILRFFSQNDIFICSSQADLNCLNLIIDKPNAIKIPFSLDESDLNCFSPSEEINELYFAGRISRQKNLHSIIKALSALKKEGLILLFHIFGDEDFLGSPNMGFEDISYKSELHKLIQEENLTNQVFFHGKKNRHELYSNFLSKRKIFISTSTHSDENFGMAAFKAICRGERLILSNWGGHRDFAPRFNQLIEYVAVIQNDEFGLVCDVEQIKIAIKNSVAKKILSQPKIEDYREKNISKQYDQLLKIKTECKQPIKFKKTFFQILEQKKIFKNHPTKIFNNYHDPLALKFFIAYGLKIT